MPGVVNPKYASPQASTGGEGGGSVDSAQVEAIVAAELDEAKPGLLSQAVSQAVAAVPAVAETVVAEKTPEILQQAASEAQTKADAAKAQAVQEADASVDAKIATAKTEVLGQAATDAQDKADAAKAAAVTDAVAQARSEVIVATNRGIKSDAKHRYSGGVIAAGSTTFNDPAMVFAEEDVGKPFYVAGAGVNGGLLEATIVSRTDIRTVELSVPATTAVTSAEYLFGTDDSAAWAALMATIYDNMVATIILPYGLSLTDPFAVRNNVKICGTQAFTPGQTQVGNIAGLVLKPGVKAAGLIQPENAAVLNAQLERLIIDGADRLHPNVITRYTGGSVTKDSNIFNAANGNFVAADVGKRFVVYGAGANGGDFVGTIFTVNSPTQIVVDNATDPHPFAVTLNNLAYAYGFYTAQGTDGVTTAGSAVFNAASANFTAADVGRAIELTAVASTAWAGDNRGEILCTRIKTVNSPTQVVLETAADIALAGVRWRVGMVHGIYQFANTAEQVTGWEFEHVIVHNTSGIGLVTGAKQRGNKLYRTYFYRCRGIGALINSSNNEIDQCASIQCGGDGVTILKPGNRLNQFRSSFCNGNGAYLAVAAEGTALIACHMESNDRNGLLSLAKNVQKLGMKYTSNSQCANGVYNDSAHTRRYATGSVGATPSGVMETGGQWILAGNGYKPNWGVESAGPNTIRGDGVQFDSSTAPFVTGSVSQAAAFGIAQGSFAIDANADIALLGNVTFSAQGAGAKFGASATEKIGFFGANPIVKPVVTGKAATATQIRNLMAALAALGLVVNNVT